MIKSEWDRLTKEYEDFEETVLAEHTADIVNEPKHYARWAIEPITMALSSGVVILLSTPVVQDTRCMKVRARLRVRLLT